MHWICQFLSTIFGKYQSFSTTCAECIRLLQQLSGHIFFSATCTDYICLPRQISLYIRLPRLYLRSIPVPLQKIYTARVILPQNYIPITHVFFNKICKVHSSSWTSFECISLPEKCGLSVSVLAILFNRKYWVILRPSTVQTECIPILRAYAFSVPVLFSQPAFVFFNSADWVSQWFSTKCCRRNEQVEREPPIVLRNLKRTDFTWHVDPVCSMSNHCASCWVNELRVD